MVTTKGLIEQLYVRGFRSVVACADQLQARFGGCIKARQARVGHGIQLMGASLECGILIMCVRNKSWNADGRHCVLILANENSCANMISALQRHLLRGPRVYKIILH